jgi:hypothetical protein
MVSPADALMTAGSMLAPGGSIVASIPNVRHISILAQLIFRGDFRYTERGILDSTHLRFFTRRSMLRLFLTAGYEVETIRGINMRRRNRLLNRMLLRAPENFLLEQYAVVAISNSKGRDHV